MQSVKEIIKARQSVRTFDGKGISEQDRQKLESYAQSVHNPFGVEVNFKFLNAKKHNLTSPVIVGADEYVGAKVVKDAQCEIAFGYSFECFCLYAKSLGIGTVILAGTLSRKTFERAMELKGGEIMPAATPIGYPAEKRSMRERMMRGAIKANEREPFEKLFYENSFASGLSYERAGVFGEALEMVRLAPSAVNKQPWRAVVCEDKVHFFEKRSKGLENELGDVQKVDMGIALAHFDLTMKESGATGEFFADKPDCEVEGGTEYIISYRLK